MLAEHPTDCFVNGVNLCCEGLQCVTYGNNPAYPGVSRHYCINNRSVHWIPYESCSRRGSASLEYTANLGGQGDDAIGEAPGHATVHVDIVMA
jgi:hypothetical protein